jgi:hypothetical protein
MCITPDPTAKCLQKDTILASLILLAHCEVHQCISTSGSEPNAFLLHLDGAQRFFELNKLEILQSRFGKALCMSLRSNAFLIGFMQRRTVPCEFGPTAYISIVPRDQPLLSLNDIALEVPDVLEAHDALRREYYPYQASTVLADQVSTFKHRLVTFFQHYYPDGKGCTTTGLSKMTIFTKYWPKRTNLFQHAFAFDSYQVWAHYAGYWSMLWELDVVLLNLLELAGIPASSQSQDRLETPLTHDSILRRAFISVRNLCLSFPASCEPDNIVFSPLRSTSSQKMRDFFDRYGYSAE